MRNSLLSGLAITAIWTTTGHAFSPRLPTTTSGNSSPCSLVVLQMAKQPPRKASMSEKRKARQSKQRGASRTNPFAEFPKSKLDFQRTAASPLLDTPLKMSDPEEAASKAKELLQKQRASVDMLTTVREKVESLSSDELTTALEKDGYYIVDGFLGDETVLKDMESEAETLYTTDGAMEMDVANLGSGEYTVAVKGGAEQYTSCPRTVEWVVSTTKHIPEIYTSDDELSLDPSACMATLRTFDRKAFQASLALLTGSEEVPAETTKPFTKIVAEDAITEDKRRLTLQYYLVPDSWDETCGGGLTFENGGSVQAKRDRLVVWKSDAASLRKEMWKGSDEMMLGSCLELHLVQKKSKF